MMKTLKVLSAAMVIVILWQSCVYRDLSDPEVVNASDESLFDEVDDSGYSYYQSGNLISPATQSPHGTYKLRFNSIALQALDGNGELPENGSFPNGSILVKEVYVNASIGILAVMKKAPTDASAGNGWLWAEYELDGTPVVSIQGRGSQCTGCHDDTPNRDFVRTFDLH